MSNQYGGNQPLSSQTTGKQTYDIKTSPTGVTGNMYTNLNDPVTGQRIK